MAAATAWVWGAVSPAKFLSAQQAPTSNASSMQAASGSPPARLVTISTSTSRGRTDGCGPAGANGQDQPLAGGILASGPVPVARRCSHHSPSRCWLDTAAAKTRVLGSMRGELTGERPVRAAPEPRVHGGGLWWNGVQRCQPGYGNQLGTSRGLDCLNRRIRPPAKLGKFRIAWRAASLVLQGTLPQLHHVDGAGWR